MKIHFSTPKLGKILSDPRLIKKYYSNDYIKLINRLSELNLANTLSDIPEVPPPRRHKLSGNFSGCWGIDYSKNDRIVIKPEGNFDNNDLKTITEITIVTLEDYH